MLQGVFGQYRIEQIIGVGGMGVVYRATDTRSDRLIAIKVLNLHAEANPTDVRRFKREAHIAQRLKHPNIIEIYDAGEIGDQAYLAMEYMVGGSLAQRFGAPRAVTLGESASILKAIASGLDYAHAQGVVHRDLKLENVLIDDHDRIVLSDFGIARLADASRLTESGQVLGTPLYMSPEQVVGSKQVDYRADLYSFAVIAYLLATGFYPFLNTTTLATLQQHLTAPPPLPSNLNPRLPTQMDWLLLKGLAKQPQDRFASAQALALAFEEAVARDPEVEIVILTSQLTPILTPSESTPAAAQGRGGATINPGTSLDGSPRPRRSLPVLGLVSAALIVVAALLVFLFSRGSLSLTPPELPATSDVGVIGAEKTETLTATLPTATGTPLPSATVLPTGTPLPSATLLPTATLFPTNTPLPTNTVTLPPTTLAPQRAQADSTSASSPLIAASPTTLPATPVPPTSKPPTATPRPATATSKPPTATPRSATATPRPPTAVPPTNTPIINLPLPTVPLVSTLLPGLLG